MSARGALSSFYSRCIRQLLRLCRRNSSSSPSSPPSESFGRRTGQQHGEGMAMITATLPALPTSAQLAQGGGRLLYRQRDPNETESMFFPVGCLPDQDTSVQARLTSLSNGHVENVGFHNLTSSDAVVLWLSYSGHEVAYLRLEPGGFEWLQTFRNHPWIFRDANTGRRLCMEKSSYSQCRLQEVAYASDGWLADRSDAYPSGLRIVEIEEPPHVRWSQEAHKVFPATFRAATAAFLLCHHVAGRQLSGSSERHGQCTLGDLPLELMMKVIDMARPEVWQQGACKHKEGRGIMGAAAVPGPLTQKERETLLSTVCSS